MQPPSFANAKPCAYAAEGTSFAVMCGRPKSVQRISASKRWCSSLVQASASSIGRTSQAFDMRRGYQDPRGSAALQRGIVESVRHEFRHAESQWLALLRHHDHFGVLGELDE